MSTAEPQLRVFDNPEALARAAAEEFLRRATAKAEAGQLFAVCLAGGSTPKGLYGRLAEAPYGNKIPWSRVAIFWGDERTVPPDHPDSNFAVADGALLYRVPIPAANVHRIEGEQPNPAEAAASYEEGLRRFFGIRAGELPRFDLVFLGLGADGHTASLFPGSEALAETRRLVVAPWVEQLGTYRVSLTCPVFNNAACIMFIVTGAEKADILRRVFKATGEDPPLPAQLIRPQDGELLWYVDREAAGAL